MTNRRRRIRTIVLRTALALASVAAACGSGQPGAESQSGDAPPGGAAPGIGATDTAAAVPLTCEDLHDTILRVPPTRRALSAAFGAPDSVHAGSEPNRHVPGATDSLFTVYYPGMVLDIRTPQDARDMATHVRLEDDRYLAFPGIGIGTSRGRLEEVLGTATQSDAQALIWDCSTAVEQPVTFHLADGRVAAITIAYYVD